MRLKRKAGVDPFVDKYNVSMPDAVIRPVDFNVRFRDNLMVITYGLFASEAAYQAQAKPIQVGSFEFDNKDHLYQWVDPLDSMLYFSDGADTYFLPNMNPVSLSQEVINRLTLQKSGKNSYDKVLLALKVLDDDVKPLTDSSKQWVMTQKDWDDKPFYENWELEEDDE